MAFFDTAATRPVRFERLVQASFTLMFICTVVPTVGVTGSPVMFDWANGERPAARLARHMGPRSRRSLARSRASNASCTRLRGNCPLRLEVTGDESALLTSGLVVTVTVLCEVKESGTVEVIVSAVLYGMRTYSLPAAPPAKQKPLRSAPESVRTSPSAKASGTVPQLAVTVMVACDDLASIVAVISATPAETAVTNPAELTVATLVAELVQDTVLPLMEPPVELTAVATSVTVPPGCKVAAVVERLTVATVAAVEVVAVVEGAVELLEPPPHEEAAPRASRAQSERRIRRFPRSGPHKVYPRRALPPPPVGRVSRAIISCTPYPSLERPFKCPRIVSQKTVPGCASPSNKPRMRGPPVKYPSEPSSSVTATCWLGAQTPWWPLGTQPRTRR